VRGLSLLCLFSLVMAGCGRVQPRISSLQLLNGMRSAFRSASVADAQVARDVSPLQTDMAALRFQSVQEGTVRVRRDARRLEKITGRNGHALRALVRGGLSARARVYVRMATVTMSLQWQEAATLERVAGLLWHDPFLLKSGSAARLHRLDAQACKQSWSAWHESVLANSYLRHHRGWFRYVSVPPTRK